MIEKKICIWILLPLFICPFVFAEVVTLTTGQVIEGTILERADEYIKIDFEGIPLVYYYNELATIDGARVPPPKNKSTTTVEGWAAWSRSVRGYLATIARLIDESETIAEQSNLELNEAMRKDAKEAGKRIIEKTGSTLSVLIDKIKALIPPQDLQGYHNKVIQTHEYRKKANDAFLRGDIDVASQYSVMSLTTEMQETEELKRVYAKKGAPQESIGYFDETIEDYKSRIKKLSSQ